jgi:hypothetical protein
MLTGCQKEKVAPMAADEEVDIFPRVRAFVERARSEAQAKDNTTISLDSAEWYLEAGINFSLAQAWLECNEYYLDSTEVYMACEANELSSSTVLAAFNELSALIAPMIVPEVNHLILSDVTFVPAPGGYTLKTLLQFGTGYEKSNGLITSFSNPYYFGNFGTGASTNCGCGTFQNGAGDCADKQIAQRINNALPGLQFPCFYTNPTSRGVSWGPWLTPTPAINYAYTQFSTGIPATPYMTFTCNGQWYCNQGGGNCLSTSQLSFYTQQGWNLMNQLKPTSPTGMVATFANLEDTNNSCPETCYWSYHMAYFGYAKLNCPK